MDREKLNKAAGEYSKKLGKCRDVTWNDGEYGFIAGADWLMQQTLSERLTDEEKEKVRKWYECATDMYVKGTPIELCGWINLMHEIFGADLFKEI